MKTFERFETKPHKKNIFGTILIILQSLLSVLFLGLLSFLNVLPIKYLIIVIVIMALLWLCTFWTQVYKKGGIVWKVIAVLLCIILAFGSFYSYKTKSMLSNITSADTKIDDISIVVLQNDPAQSISDTKNYTFGIQKTLDIDNTNTTIKKLNTELTTEIATKQYPDLNSQVNALYNGEVNAIIINEAYRDPILDIYSDFNEKTRVLTSNQIESDMNIEKSDKIEKGDPFTVYISGIDTYGPISKTSRSDVNIIATVNPKTKQILLTTTPRDYYVHTTVSGNQRDKLTHSGIYGIDSSVGTMENLYGINIDYYVRLNFTSLVKMVDALGGITVNSEYDFTSRWGDHFNKGENTLNGATALSFSRERYSFASGDNQRGKDQTIVLEAMIKKAASPAILTSYSSVMDSIAGSFETNMSSGELTKFAKMQLNDMTPWNIVSNSVTGTGDSQTTYSTGSQKLYVMIPDETSITEAKEKMKQVVDGTVISN